MNKKEELSNIRKVCILGTCRVSNLPLKSIKFINPNMDAGNSSKLYVTEKNIEIHCQPITYSTKLADVRDILKYLQGKIYENMDPNKDINLFNIFFRRINKSAFDNKILKKPGEIINNKDNNYDVYIFEICSTREIIFKNDKYGKEYINKNLI
jgi:hypothetical protein